MIDFIDKTIARLMISRIEKGYGKRCGDFDAGCSTCHAWNVIDWLKGHIDLINDNWTERTILLHDDED